MNKIIKSGGYIMKRTMTIAVFVIFCAGIIFGAPRIKLVTEYVTPNMLATNSAFTGDSTVANGLGTVAKGTYVYFRAWNFGDTTAITSSVWTMLQKPATATLAGVTGLPTWQKFVDLSALAMDGFLQQLQAEQKIPQ
jgi:hypothetical protein